jgi:nucleoside-diphosphate-sugar epimerase
VFDGGDQERCPTAVWDLCDFILNCDPREHPGLVVNVGNPENRITITELAHMVRDLAISGSEIEFTSGKAIHGSAYEEAMGRVKVPDILTAASLGWQPKVGLREMVKRTLAETGVRV